MRGHPFALLASGWGAGALYVPAPFGGCWGFRRPLAHAPARRRAHACGIRGRGASDNGWERVPCRSEAEAWL
ncbi:MAG: hypothetical protein R2795_17070 [Saprospiraceae bacterium]